MIFWSKIIKNLDFQIDLYMEDLMFNETKLRSVTRYKTFLYILIFLNIGYTFAAHGKRHFHIYLHNSNSDITDVFAEPEAENTVTTSYMLSNYIKAESSTEIFDLEVPVGIVPCKNLYNPSCNYYSFTIYGKNKNTGLISQIAAFGVTPYYYTDHKWVTYYESASKNYKVSYNHSDNNYYITINQPSQIKSEINQNQFYNVLNSVATTNNGQNVYVGTSQGLAISTDGGKTFNFVSDPELDSDIIHKVMIDSDNFIYAATQQGLIVSTDNGKTSKKYTTANGLGDNSTYDVALGSDKSTIYVATYNGLSISTDGGQTFTNKTVVNGLGSNWVLSVTVGSDGTIYAGTNGGLSVSSDGGQSFKTYTMLNGLGNNTVNGVTLSNNGESIFVATNWGIGVNTNRLSTPSFTNIEHPISHNASNFIHNITLDSNQNLFIANDDVLYMASLTRLDDPFVLYTLINYHDDQPTVWYSALHYVALGGSTIYVATDIGLAISRDGGQTFENIPFYSR